MKKRPLARIKAIKQRFDITPWFSHIEHLKDMDVFFQDLHKNKSIVDIKAYEYIPVTIVSCYQSFLRVTIQEILKLGDPYMSNSKKLLEVKTLKLEVDDLQEINHQEINLPEIISHSFSFNSLESINVVLSTILGENFLTSFKKFNYEAYPEKQKKITPFQENRDFIIKDVSSTYKLRHIYCHEFMSLIKTDVSTLLRYLSNSIVFLEALNVYLNNVINKSRYSLQRSKIKHPDPKRSFFETEERLISLLKDIIYAPDAMGLDNRVLDETLTVEMQLWKKYRQKQAKQLSEFYLTSTSRYKERYWEIMESLTEEKIHNLEILHQDSLSWLRKLESIEHFY